MTDHQSTTSRGLLLLSRGLVSAKSSYACMNHEFVLSVDTLVKPHNLLCRSTLFQASPRMDGRSARVHLQQVVLVAVTAAMHEC